ncbi:dihydroflavonol-4-reductase [Bradyrhizobium sp. R2.2-H]|jgi:dihydroflavonol-4-reductase|uniref:SDR family oxidoreductase n=1 Tax=unclassified Bradyrhizobium TaxID=2631580 RepID=UPI001051DEE5|nr:MULTISPECIES: aldehyde reductase [unclassified Bradyrhizobium]TCU59166.1 dihydroflavonol-4-reductase [Bradyrhizobium sp. Y-H1]TCU63337.1 dihydroflavonol-4-reductase [Bradyrhizobium sp. R2.2-H]
MSTVLVTGGSGFVGIHVVLQLLAAGHAVRTTVRRPDRRDDVLAMLREGGAAAPETVSFFTADLTADAGWREAIDGCDYVLHVASPLSTSVPKDENEMIVPARDGTLRVLRAAREAGVRRVVITSSLGAIGYGHPAREKPFDETDWTNLDGPGLQPYIKSKTLAERAAWDFIAREGGGLELSVVNPAGIFGPVLGPDFSGSIEIVKSLLDGAMPAVPRVYFGVVDVRDVADLHLRAMTAPEARGERFIAVSGEMSILDIAKVLRRELGPSARRVPRFQAPDWLVRLAATRIPLLRAVVPMLGRVRHSTSAKARSLLGWEPRSSHEAILATAESLIRLGLVKA